MQEDTFFEKIQQLSNSNNEENLAYALRVALYDEKQRRRCKRLDEIMQRAQNRLGIAMQLKGNAMDKAITEIDSVLNSLTAARHLMVKIERKAEICDKVRTARGIAMEA